MCLTTTGVLLHAWNNIAVCNGTVTDVPRCLTEQYCIIIPTMLALIEFITNKYTIDVAWLFAKFTIISCRQYPTLLFLNRSLKGSKRSVRYDFYQIELYNPFQNRSTDKINNYIFGRRITFYSIEKHIFNTMRVFLYNIPFSPVLII